MKFWLFLGSLGIFIMLLPGCYTQMQATRDRDYIDDDHASYPTADTSTLATDTTRNDSVTYDQQGTGYAEDNNPYYDDGWHSHYGFSYYYPSAYYGSYYDPWFYDPYFYSPYIGCGPFYSYGYPYYHGGYYGYYGGGYYGGYGHGYYGNNGGYRQPVRTFGSGRGVSGGNASGSAGISTGRAMGNGVVLPSTGTAMQNSGMRTGNSRGTVTQAPRSSSRGAATAAGRRAAARGNYNNAPAGRRTGIVGTRSYAPQSRQSGGRQVTSQPSGRSTPSYSPRSTSAPRSSGGGMRSSSGGGARSSGGGGARSSGGGGGGRRR